MNQLSTISEKGETTAKPVHHSKLHKHSSEGAIRHKVNKSKFENKNFEKFHIDKDTLTIESLIVKFDTFIQLLSPTTNSAVPEDKNDDEVGEKPNEMPDADKLIKLWVKNNSVIDNEITSLIEKVTRFIKM